MLLKYLLHSFFFHEDTDAVAWMFYFMYAAPGANMR
jgi:hypothetical protein